MVSRPFRIAACAALACALGGCLSTNDDYLVTGNPVNPAPVERYRVECRTGPGALTFIAGDLVTNCRQFQDPQAAVALRARG